MDTEKRIAQLITEAHVPEYRSDRSLQIEKEARKFYGHLAEDCIIIDIEALMNLPVRGFLVPGIWRDSSTLVPVRKTFLTDYLKDIETPFENIEQMLLLKGVLTPCYVLKLTKAIDSEEEVIETLESDTVVSLDIPRS
ncbi:MAG TPA: hypothetical protein PL009_07740 [Flavipsychrobacter sp.]|nr:hypothetical protein [Flavipsychrobacter sp.]